MKQLPWVIVTLGWLTSTAAAGPNAGGTLIVHDTGILYSNANDLPQPPESAPPATCGAVDNQVVPGVGTDQTVWKVYAAFDPGASPRLKGLCWGISRLGILYVTAAGLPYGPNFEVTQLGWPQPGPEVNPQTDEPASIGQSFGLTQSGTIIECYWFGGYGYQDAVFKTRTHASQPSEFADDSGIQQYDPILGFSTLGFGGAGTTECPAALGTCCEQWSGLCEMTREQDCTSGRTWHREWTTCTPNPCPPSPLGACCFNCGQTCVIRTEYYCIPFGAEHWAGPNTECLPNPCPPLLGACCAFGGSCTVTIAADCPGTSIWHCRWVCEPNSCPVPPTLGACCDPEGYCDLETEPGCPPSSTWMGPDTDCSPNPCPQDGACCLPAGECLPSILFDDCVNLGGLFRGVGTGCAPDPCPGEAYNLEGASEAPAGQQLDIVVEARNSLPLKGYSVNLRFDPAVFEFVGSSLAGTRGEQAVVFASGHTDHSARAGVIYAYTCPPSIGAGSGPLLMVTLRVRSSAPLGPTELLLQDELPSLNRMVPCAGGAVTPVFFPWTMTILPATGACCFRNASCIIMDSARCARLRGSFRGYGSACLPNPCALPKVGSPIDDGARTLEGSWGQVKNRYR